MSVTVWWASPKHASPWHDELLTPGERERADAYRRREDRDRFVAANALLRLAVEQWLGHRPEIDRACIDCGKPHGKPRVVGAGLHASVSHSGDLIAVALSEQGELGVDVEMVSDKDLKLLLRYVFSAKELEVLPDPLAVFYRAWTRKESLLKATGAGLRTPMSSLTVLPESEYNMHDLDPGPGYAAALTVLSSDPVSVTELDGAALLKA
ncbi:4'-phosphopantetheinyl transferase family protein [Allorhizocola rhizosphaerae]|uniref:4'-phosphopantetheinyl transferase family protein n=1 Tax=Allorhizocola rhizosphaerae TaxID=1872709 RepID=UPI0013C32C77|nr:4'-phosphopantetheinyl transferase superfamily protein [Allorhizocola rhizosphaerae]